MAATAEEGLETVRSLVHRFNADATGYRQPSYLEASLRDEFLLPFFEALGWDMNNRRGHSLSRREVVVELSTDSGRPDYTFRHGNETVLIVEAKRPYEDIATNRSHAYQVRNYGHSAKVPVAILTNFDEFACYRCDIKPRAGDGPEVARIGPVLKYSEYLAEWKNLYNTFGKDAVFGDSLVRLARPNVQRTMIGADFSGSKFPSAPQADQVPAPQASAVQTVPGMAPTLPSSVNSPPAVNFPMAGGSQGRTPRQTPIATVAMRKKVAASAVVFLVAIGIAWRACAPSSMPPVAGLVNCTIAARVSFHLRPRPTASSIGPIFPAGTQMYLLAPIDGIIRNGEVLFHVQVLPRGQTGYAFVGPSEAAARFNCPSR